MGSWTWEAGSGVESGAGVMFFHRMLNEFWTLIAAISR
jgi:hypothetical protein